MALMSDRARLLGSACLGAWLLVGCGSGSVATSAPSVPAGAPSAAPATAVPATSVPATLATATTAPPTISSTAPPSAPPSISPTAAPPSRAGAQVNLTFTGTKDFTAIGSAGRCILIRDSSGAITQFGFEATESDYPGLGLSFSLAELSPGFVDIKWVLANGTDAYGRPGPAHGGSDADIVESADKHAVSMDVELDQFHKQGDPGPGPEHVSGTVVCP